MRTDTPPPQDSDIVHRHHAATRIWHWVNAFAVLVMLMSGLMIFNAHPMLYWGKYGANYDYAWFAITSGHVRFLSLTVPTFGLLGRHTPSGFLIAFPPLVTIPDHYDLAGAREWHFAVAWLLVVPGLVYWVWGFARRHFQRDLAPTAEELRASHLLHDIKQHATLNFPTGEAARRYNVLQKLAYIGVLFIALPLIVLTGLTMSPNLDAAWPWLLDLFGGRQSARSIHFLCAMALVLFMLIHLIMVVLAGPINEVRSMITGRYRLPKAKAK